MARVRTSSFTRSATDASSADTSTWSMRSAMRSISRSRMPRVVTAGVPMRTPLVTNGFLRLLWHGVLVHRDPREIECLLGGLAGETFIAEIDEHEMVVRSAGHELVAARDEGLRERLRVGDDALRIVDTKARRSSASNATALAAITCSSGPPCQPGNTVLATMAACSVLQRIMPPRGRAASCERGGRDDVGVRHRRGYTPVADEPREVRHVDHEDRPTSLAIGERGEVDHARVGAL